MAKNNVISFRCTPEFKEAVNKASNGDMTTYIENLIKADITKRMKETKNMEKKYIVDFGTGVTEECETLEEAKKYAEDNCSYTQQSIKIIQGGEEVAVSRWYGVPAGEEDEGIAYFSDFGFYGEWEER